MVVNRSDSAIATAARRNVNWLAHVRAYHVWFDNAVDVVKGDTMGIFILPVIASNVTAAEEHAGPMMMSGRGRWVAMI